MARTKVETNIYYDDVRKLFYVNMDYGKDSEGKRHQEQKTFRTKKEAKLALAKFQASRLAEICREAGTSRVCPVQSGSLNAYLRRAFTELGMTEYTQHKTGFHALRKLAAQRHFDDCRGRGLSVKEALSETSVFLGHGRDREELMKHYVLDIK